MTSENIMQSNIEQEEFKLVCDMTWGGYWYDVEDGYLREHADTQSGSYIRNRIKLTPGLINELKKIKYEYSSFDVRRIEKIDELIKHEKFRRQNGL